MYHIHLTKAFVIDKLHTKDDDASLVLLTEDFGLIRAYTYGLRKMKSKLRYVFQVGNYCEVALVRGKAGWQITNGILLEEKPVPLEIIQLLHRLGTVIQRIVPYEQESGSFQIYRDVKDILMGERHHYESKQAALYVAVLNVLDTVGYGIGYTLNSFSGTSFPYTEETFQYILQNQQRINKDIQSALTASQL